MSDRAFNQNAEVISSEDAIFDDIRPCRDDEAQAELAKIANDEALVKGIVKFRYPKLQSWFGPVLRFFVRSQIKKSVNEIHSIQDFQLRVAEYMEKMMATTTDGVTFSGFDKLDPKYGYLFISNHRDISLDPALIDYALHQVGFNTVRIAIGDNLLKMQAATALMRLNKSFIVKRSVTSHREKLKEINHLSQYIGLSLLENNSIWIAQREGRAKDGNDCTEEAVLKMLHMYGRSQKRDFAEYMSSVKIVPVSITYEYDPGDFAKANELHEKSLNDGKYQKGEFEDIQSIVDGIKGYKGRVSVIAGEPIVDNFTDPKSLAKLIDTFIYSNYTMYPSVLISAVQIGVADESILSEVSEADKIKFLSRIQAYPEHLQNRIYSMYAAPYINQQKILSGSFEGNADECVQNTPLNDTLVKAEADAETNNK